MIPNYEIGANEVLTQAMMAEIIQDYLTNKVHRMAKLEKYFLGKNDICQRTIVDPYKPNNKIANAYANDITNTMVGYFMGTPVVYQFEDNNNNADLFKGVLKQNNENKENSALAQDCSIYGFGAEIVYIDEHSKLSFDRLNPIGIIMIYDNTVKKNLRYVIKLDKVPVLPHEINEGYIATVYSDTHETVYKFYNKVVTFIEEREHMMGAIPVVIYKNNQEMMGDFEVVMSLIDAYDKLESDSINDFEAFVDSYLKITGMDLTEEEAAAMRENRILLLPEGGDASWLTKAQQDTYIENLKSRIDKDIYKFSKCPNLNDENFGSNLSGIAIEYKTMGMENKCATKQNYFDTALRERASLLNNILTLFGSPVDLDELDIIFTRNLPVNYSDTADIINKLSSVLSKETLLTLLPFVKDVNVELERKQAEADAAMASFFEPSEEPTETEEEA